MTRRAMLLTGVLLSWQKILPVHAQENSSPTTVYVDSLLKAPTTHFQGCEHYQSIQAVINGMAYEHSLLTGVQNHDAPGQRYSWLTLELNEQYERFQAMVGRDDKQHIYGPAYCVFEVWGDGVRLFHSEAIRSSVTYVAVDDSYGSKRKAPQEVDISVKGVKLLRLVTRFATEFTQSARYVHRALGCVWTEARLTPVKSAVSGGNSVISSSSEVAVAARTAAIELTRDVPRREAGVDMPYRVAVTPLRLEATAVHGGVITASSETGVRNGILQMICSLRRQSGVTFTPLQDTDAKAVADALPAESPLRNKPEVVASIGQGVNADYVILGSVDRATDGWVLDLSLFDVSKQKVVRQTSAPITIKAAATP